MTNIGYSAYEREKESNALKGGVAVGSTDKHMVTDGLVSEEWPRHIVSHLHWPERGKELKSFIDFNIERNSSLFLLDHSLVHAVAYAVKLVKAGINITDKKNG